MPNARQQLESGHVVDPVRRYVMGHGVSDSGRVEWHWRCIYCHESHYDTSEFSDGCDP